MQINDKIHDRVNNDSIVIENIVIDIVSKQTSEIDEYVNKIKMVLEEESDDLTIEDLNRIMIRLCSYAYFLTSKQELIGIRQDISKAIKSEKYNDKYMGLTVGTVAKKVAQAESAVKEEAVVALIYDRAYKILKGKNDSVNRMIDAVKKIISARIQLLQIGMKEQ